MISTSVLCNPSAWLIQIDGLYLALDGTVSITHPSAPNTAQCAIIAYDSTSSALEIGAEPVAGQPYDPPYVHVDPSTKRAGFIADMSLADPAAGPETLGNWQVGDLGARALGEARFGLAWTVPGLGEAAFQIDGEEYLWAIFGGEGISGARSVNLTIHLNDS